MIETYNANIRDGWEIRVEDHAEQGKLKENKNRYNHEGNYDTCRVRGCNVRLAWNSVIGRCKEHREHQNDLVLFLKRDNEEINYRPVHLSAIDALLHWADDNSISLSPLFSALSRSIIGQVQDVSILANVIEIDNVEPQSMDALFSTRFEEVNQIAADMDLDLDSELELDGHQVSLEVVIKVVTGLIVCEEANRGDRWFARELLGDAQLSTAQGGIMPITHFAVKSFDWGMELSSKLFRR